MTTYRYRDAPSIPPSGEQRHCVFSSFSSSLTFSVSASSKKSRRYCAFSPIDSGSPSYRTSSVSVPSPSSWLADASVRRSFSNERRTPRARSGENRATRRMADLEIAGFAPVHLQDLGQRFLRDEDVRESPFCVLSREIDQGQPMAVRR